MAKFFQIFQSFSLLCDQNNLVVGSSYCIYEISSYLFTDYNYTFNAIDASSGYFSALDQTDFEDVGPATTATHSMQTAPQVPFIPGSHAGVSPMIIMNNLVLKQVFQILRNMFLPVVALVKKSTLLHIYICCRVKITLMLSITWFSFYSVIVRESCLFYLTIDNCLSSLTVRPLH